MVAMRGDPAGVACQGSLPTPEGRRTKAVYDRHVRGLGPSGRWSWVAARSADKARYGNCGEEGLKDGLRLGGRRLTTRTGEGLAAEQVSGRWVVFGFRHAAFK